MDGSETQTQRPRPEGGPPEAERPTFLEEMRRFVRFTAEDEQALRELAPHAAPHLGAIAEAFYEHLLEHPGTRRVLSGPDRVQRLNVTLREWMDQLLAGPWDDRYFERRARIGRVHVRIGLPERYMIGAMGMIRAELSAIAQRAFAGTPERGAHVVSAVGKLLDLELGIILETYGEAHLERVRQQDRLERGDLEQRLSMSEARYREIVETAEALITTFDERGSLLFVNRGAQEVLGVREGGGRTWFELFVPAAHRDAVRTLCRQILGGERGIPYEGSFHDDGGRERRVRWHFTTLPSPAGALLCAIGVDVTEERELAARARRAERLAALGTMTAGLAHELRNPLNAAHLQLSVVARRLRQTPQDTEAALAAVRIVDDEMRRLGSLLEEFLDFSRPHPLRLTNIDLRGIVGDVLSLLAPEAAAAGVALSLAPGAEVHARVDAERMKQVLLNLVRNAIEASGGTGKVEVEVRAHPDLASIAVSDEGPGLSSSEARIFEPFFTTKNNGTGLGLSIVHRIVSDHEGEITVRRQDGRTVFTVFVPR